MSTIASDIPANQLRGRFEAVKGHAALARHLAWGIDNAVRLMRERANAHDVLGETEASKALRSAADAADANSKQLSAESEEQEALAKAIEERIEKEGPL